MSCFFFHLEKRYSEETLFCQYFSQEEKAEDCNKKTTRAEQENNITHKEAQDCRGEVRGALYSAADAHQLGR